MRLSRIFHPNRPRYDEIVAAAYAASRTDPASARPHGLPLPLIVSLTSYPPRFATLIHTLRSLLLQDTRPDAIELYLVEADAGALPQEVLDLGSDGLQMRFTGADIGPYNKYVPARIAHPDAIIVTVDDDVYYQPTWLGELISEWAPDQRLVLTNRAHRLVATQDGTPLPFRHWPRAITDNRADWTVVPAGNGGTLYPPGIHHPDLFRQDRFMSLCPGTDDIWFYWMALLTGASFRKVGPPYHLITWSGSQRHALWRTNFKGGNDRAVAAMVAAYGTPRSLSSSSAGSG
ncbi:MAG TPA: hypothetical protein VG757_10455 [Devosia sp.]|nr:hypothetical protein [Devosia sp.]